MAEPSELATIAAFRSFHKAGDELALSASTWSDMTQKLEQNIGIRRFHRTMAARRRMKQAHICCRVSAPYCATSTTPWKKSTLSVKDPTSCCASTLVKPPRAWFSQTSYCFLTRYPDMALDLVAEGKLNDIVAEGFDADIRLGKSVS